MRRHDQRLYRPRARKPQAVSLAHTRIVARAQGLTVRAKNVLRVIADRADKHGRCFPSQECLAFDTGMSPRSIWTALQELTESGWIVRTRRWRKDGSRCSDLIEVQDLEAAAAHVAASLKLPLMVTVDGANSQHLRLGQLATFARQEEPIKEEPNLKKEKTGSRPPHKSGDRPSEDQHQMAERLRRMG